MSINFGYTDGAANCLHKIRGDLFREADNHVPRVSSWDGAKRGTQWIRLFGLPIGGACALATVICRTIAVVESLFKGFANIFGAPFSKRCEVLRGLKQLFVDLPINAAKLILLMPLEVAGDLLVTPLAMLDFPQYARARKAFEYGMYVFPPKSPLADAEW